LRRPYQRAYSFLNCAAAPQERKLQNQKRQRAEGSRLSNLIGKKFMRKQIIDRVTPVPTNDTRNWLDLESIARVEVTSEDKKFPIESALLAEKGPGWRASHSGEQSIRLFFDEPQRIKLIELRFTEAERARTQEFLLRWSGAEGLSYQEIVRQQYSFSPPGTVHEREIYAVDLNGVTVLELSIVPDISGGGARASLAQLRLA
jgi:hypothetical protein